MIILLLLHYGEDFYSFVQLSAKVWTPVGQNHETNKTFNASEGFTDDPLNIPHKSSQRSMIRYFIV